MRSFNRGDLLLSYIMSRLPVLLAVLFYGVVEAFVWSPALLAGRGNAVCEFFGQESRYQDCSCYSTYMSLRVAAGTNTLVQRNIPSASINVS